MKYLKFMPYNTVVNASRNRREMLAAAEDGYEVYCYSRDRTVPENTKNQPFHMLCDETPPVSYSLPKAKRMARIMANKLRHIRRVRSLGMDVISCHNLEALALAWWANLGAKKKAKLIYDSHEFELYRKKRGRFTFLITKWRERFLIRRCAFSIMINDGIADEVRRIHGLKTKPVVVRSTPEYWRLDEETIKKQENEYRNRLGIGSGVFIAIYTGYLTQYRGIEELIKAMRVNPDFCAVLVGDADKREYEEQIMALAEDLGVTDRILRYPSQPHDQLWRFIAAASASAVMNDDKNPNYHYALPNKFFESIQSATPVVCADSPEMSRIVNSYRIGLLVPSGEAELLAEAIGRLTEDEDMYRAMKKNVLKAKEELCWENESRRLKDAFAHYL